MGCGGAGRAGGVKIESGPRSGKGGVVLLGIMRISIFSGVESLIQGNLLSTWGGWRTGGGCGDSIGTFSGEASLWEGKC